jgi:hypothetical protein
LSEKGLDFYGKLFPAKATPDQVKGEKTPAYLFLSEIPERVFKAYPQIKLIVILRNSVERAFLHIQTFPF